MFFGGNRNNKKAFKKKNHQNKNELKLKKKNNLTSEFFKGKKMRELD